jgi:hypothetical protein
LLRRFESRLVELWDEGKRQGMIWKEPRPNIESMKAAPSPKDQLTDTVDTVVKVAALGFGAWVLYKIFSDRE